MPLPPLVLVRDNRVMAHPRVAVMGDPSIAVQDQPLEGGVPPEGDGEGRRSLPFYEVRTQTQNLQAFQHVIIVVVVVILSVFVVAIIACEGIVQGRGDGTCAPAADAAVGEVQLPQSSTFRMRHRNPRRRLGRRCRRRRVDDAVDDFFRRTTTTREVPHQHHRAIVSHVVIEEDQHLERRHVRQRPEQVRELALLEQAIVERYASQAAPRTGP